MVIILASIIAIATTIATILFNIAKESADALFKVVQLLSSHFLLAFAFVLFLLFADAQVFGKIGFGIVGGIITAVFYVMGIPFTITSFQLMIILIVAYIFMFALKRSRQPMK